MRLSKHVIEELKDQAYQILYFESAMADEDKAFEALLQRLVSVYEAGAESVK
jgi:hypothetical protein